MAQLIKSAASSTHVMQSVQWIRKQGFKPVPLRPHSKAAISQAYVAADYKPPDDDLWRNNDYGVGVVTGPKQGGPLDSDLDCDEAVFFAPKFLPETKAVFGRASKPRSHYIYRTDAAAFQTMAIRDIDNKSTIIEIRGDGGSQTVFPGSIHEGTGELIEWSHLPFPEVTTVPLDVLVKGVKTIALATLITRHIWQPGYHNEPCKHLAGMFFYLDWSLEDTEALIAAVMEYCGDDDKSRMPTLRAAYRRGAEGKKISGAGVLRKQLNNDALVDKLLELAGSATVNLLQEYNDKYAVTMLRGKFRIAKTDVPPGEVPVFYQKEDFLNRMQADYSDVVNEKTGKAVPKSSLWLTNPRRRTYDAADFMPGVEEAHNVLNLWTGWAAPPLPPVRGKKAIDEGCEAWLELLRDVICGGDADLSRWLEHWFANILREPADKSMTAVVIIGQEGAGKSLLLDYFGKILGQSYVIVKSDRHLVGNFNSHMGGALLLHSEEALYGGDKKHAGIIRDLITGTSHLLELKGVDPVKVRNYIRLVLTSNEIYAAPAKPGDRRYTVINMDKRMISSDLIERVLKERDNDGPSALHRYLISMDYDRRLPRVNCKNDSLLTLKSYNMNATETWWYDTLSSGQILPDYLGWATRPEKENWPPVVSSVALHASLTISMRDRGSRSMVPSAVMLAFHLDQFTGAKLRRAQRTYANPLIEDAPPITRHMGASQSSIVNMPSLAICREAFESYLGQAIEWPEAEPPQPPREKKPHEKY